MPVFGGYETVAQLSPTPFGSVYKAKAAGGAAANFIIKTFSPLGADAAELKRHPDVKKFLGSAELQKLVAATSKHWAPVHEMGVSNEGAYYVSTFYPTSASRLIKGKTKLGSDDFFELTQAILAGLVSCGVLPALAWESVAQRDPASAHGCDGIWAGDAGRAAGGGFDQGGQRAGRSGSAGACSV